MKRLKIKFIKLVDAYLNGTANEQQLDLIDQYYDSFDIEPEVLELADAAEAERKKERIKTAIDIHLSMAESPVVVAKQHPVTFRLWKYISIAAAIFLAVAAGFYFYQNKSLKPEKIKNELTANIIPGGNKAVLTLANGSKIALTDAENGQIATQEGIVVNKTKDGNLVYNGIAIKGTEDGTTKPAYNSIETPKGGQYHVILPDGTKVWLNASSSLKYPVSFAVNERKVELKGEAYFEVTSDKTKPFRVSTDQQVVEVLGTHFNINAYKDEQFMKTTLLEGSVQVSNVRSNDKVVIKPGQQAVINTSAVNQQITIKNIDTDESVAWKNGYFMFDDEPLESILRKVSRWYDVDIEYKRPDQIKGITFNGTLSKYSDVGKVLNKLERSGSLRFKIEGKKIIVMPLQ